MADSTRRAAAPPRMGTPRRSSRRSVPRTTPAPLALRSQSGRAREHTSASRRRVVARLGRASLFLLAVVVGGGIALAGADALSKGSERAGTALGSFVGRMTGGRPPVDLATHVDPPVLERPVNEVMRASRWELAGSLPPGVAGADGFYLRIYVNGQLARERRVPETTSFTIPDIPVPEGRSRISASIRGPGVDSGMSEEIEVLFDGSPPPLVIASPAQGERIGAERALVRGTTEPGARITVANATTGGPGTTVAGDDGSFAVEVGLGPGRNALTVRAGDAAGNTTEKALEVVRRESDVLARLMLSPTVLALSDLPAPVSISVVARHRDGRPVEGAAVTFSLSPPGLPTSTFHTTTTGGRAQWTNVVIPKEGALAGEGLVTVRVVLPNGRSAQQVTRLVIE